MSTRMFGRFGQVWRLRGCSDRRRRSGVDVGGATASAALQAVMPALDRLVRPVGGPPPLRELVGMRGGVPSHSSTMSTASLSNRPSSAPAQPSVHVELGGSRRIQQRHRRAGRHLRLVWRPPRHHSYLPGVVRDVPGWQRQRVSGKARDIIEESVRYAAGTFTLTVADASSHKTATDKGKCSSCLRGRRSGSSSARLGATTHSPSAHLFALANFGSTTMSEDTAGTVGATVKGLSFRSTTARST